MSQIFASLCYCDLVFTFSLASLCVQKSSGNNEPAGEGRAQQATNKLDHLKNKYKEAAGLNDDVESKLYVFYQCKLINTLLKIADPLTFCSYPGTAEGQQETQGCYWVLVCPPG